MGVLIFIVGRFIEKMIIDPIQRQKFVIGEIAEKLVIYSNVFANNLYTSPARDAFIVASDNEDAKRKFF
ncbi:hypothetical protein BACCIP111895_01333 [Neobacillus rhizosphaerae]|uniref:Uncharacterized protein n=1 Tax=Neobacillus rhizosphaerae TaxID=2880965 RepID=A0ABN8KLN5_9BACI|nr:hypothetical protein [Neobacillus rhizosphaerae]CAH2714179.1 hypothetical protein BACCIP111895_01333 [Neobacillus rhizosphaerae]